MSTQPIDMPSLHVVKAYILFVQEGQIVEFDISDSVAVGGAYLPHSLEIVREMC